MMEDNEETGWKYIHGDVFRFPPQLNLFCAFIGTGTQARPAALLRLGDLEGYHGISARVRVGVCCSYCHGLNYGRVMEVGHFARVSALASHDPLLCGEDKRHYEGKEVVKCGDG
jgi:Endomembrane protein 70